MQSAQKWQQSLKQTAVSAASELQEFAGCGRQHEPAVSQPADSIPEQESGPPELQQHAENIAPAGETSSVAASKVVIASCVNRETMNSILNCAAEICTSGIRIRQALFDQITKPITGLLDFFTRLAGMGAIPLARFFGAIRFFG